MVGGAYAPQHRWRRSIQVARLPSHSQGYCSTHEISQVITLNLAPKLCRPLAGFFQVDVRGGLGQGTLCERISGPGGLRARTRAPRITKKTGPRGEGLRGLQKCREASEPPGPSSNSLQAPSGPSDPSNGSTGLQDFRGPTFQAST